MNNFFRKINLTKDITIQLPISKIDFIQKFRSNVDESNLGYVPFEVFQSSRNEYKGTIENDTFQLRKRRKLFDMNYSFAKATGKLTQANDQLNIKAEISCFRKRMIPLFILIVLFYLIFVVGIISFEDDTALFFVIPFLLFHMSIMILIPYFMMKRSVSRMVYDLERDFHYWVTKN